MCIRPLYRPAAGHPIPGGRSLLILVGCSDILTRTRRREKHKAPQVGPLGSQPKAALPFIIQ